MISSDLRSYYGRFLNIIRLTQFAYITQTNKLLTELFVTIVKNSNFSFSYTNLIYSIFFSPILFDKQQIITIIRKFVTENTTMDKDFYDNYFSHTYYFCYVVLYLQNISRFLKGYTNIIEFLNMRNIKMINKILFYSELILAKVNEALLNEEVKQNLLDILMSRYSNNIIYGEESIFKEHVKEQIEGL